MPLIIDSQNYNGLSTKDGGTSGKIEEQLQTMRLRDRVGPFAVLIQETKMYSERSMVEYGDSVLVLAGRDRPKGVTTKCRAGGAGILLSAAATQSWKDGGSWVRRYGGDIVAIRVKAHNRRGGRAISSW